MDVEIRVTWAPLSAATRLGICCALAAVVASTSLLAPARAAAVAAPLQQPKPAALPQRPTLPQRPRPTPPLQRPKPIALLQRPGPVAPSRRPLPMPADGPYLHTDGAIIRDARGHAVRLSGVNWSGLETCTFVPSGLGQRSWWDVLDQVRALGFNVIRLPYSDQVLDPASRPQGLNETLNPDLHGLSALQVMDRIIAGAGRRGLRVILDRHRPDCASQWPLWYSPQLPEQRWIADLARLARRYRHQPAVIGFDLSNEPHPPATWGDGNPGTDWRLAAERAGDAVLRANPHLLIFVEGIGTYQHKADWWGGNLLGAGVAPVRLAVPHRLVYEPHDYGPALSLQPWFSAPDFPLNLPTMWDHHWGYLQERNIAPVVLGEFGGLALAPALPARPAPLPAPRPARGQGPTGAQRAAADALWLRALVSYLAHHRAIGFIYWSLMPDSPDVGSLLNDDWLTANTTKQAALAALQGAPIPLPQARPAPAAVRVLASDQLTSANQQNLIIRLVNDSPRALDLQHVDLQYWLGRVRERRAPAGSAQAAQDAQRTADVDYASTGPGTVVPLAGSRGGYGVVTLGFTALAPAAGTLAPFGGVAVIALRIHRLDWAPYTPVGDWSYTSSAVPIVAPRLTLSSAGRLLWGRLPPAALPAHRRGHRPLGHGHTRLRHPD